jgi:hypothetical protein
MFSINGMCAIAVGPPVTRRRRVEGVVTQLSPSVSGTSASPVSNASRICRTRSLPGTINLYEGRNSAAWGSTCQTSTWPKHAMCILLKHSRYRGSDAKAE